MMFFRTVLKSSNYNLEEKSTFFAAPEEMTEFSTAWCLSIVSHGVRYIRTSFVQPFVLKVRNIILPVFASWKVAPEL